MRYYIISGEASGDLHAANLLKELKKLDPAAEARAWGGELLEEAGAEVVKNYRDLAFMGFKEVAANLNTIFKNIRFCKEDISAWNPDVIIFIDYPGFNLRIAEWARKEGYKTIYYISPQLWAWKEGRVKKIKRDVDKMIVILPFEEEFYGKHDYKVEYVGHPLLDVVESYTPEPFDTGGKPIIALLPGSRKQEISKMLPVMLSMEKHFPDYKFIIAGAPGQERSFYEQFIQHTSANLVFRKTYALLSQASAAVVTSGTATLEAALFEAPEVVCYKGSKLSFWIGKQLVKVKFISLVNLIMDREVVKELIQDDFTEEKLKQELGALLNNEQRLAQLKKDYRELKQKLGGMGASKRAAEVIYKFLQG